MSMIKVGVSLILIFILSSLTSFYSLNHFYSSYVNETYLDVALDLVNFVDDMYVERYGYNFNVLNVPKGPGYWDSWEVLDLVSSMVLAKILNASDFNISYAINWISNHQYPDGSFSHWYEKHNVSYYNSSYVVYKVVEALSLFGMLDRVDRDSIIGFVLRRWNSSVGGFQAVHVYINGTLFAHASFLFTSGVTWEDVLQNGYYPNVLDTFDNLGILYYLDALDVINVSKVAEFLLSIKNGGLFLPNPFDLYHWRAFIDYTGTSLPLIYAGVMSLYFINRLDLLTPADRENIKNYILQLRKYPSSPYFCINLYYDEATLHEPLTIYWVARIAKILGFFDEILPVIEDMFDNMFSNIDFMGTGKLFLYKPLKGSIIPLPDRSVAYESLEFAGHFWTFMEPLIFALNESNLLHYLNKLNPRAIKTREKFLEFSIKLSIMLTLITYVASWLVVSKIKDLLKKKSS